MWLRRWNLLKKETEIFKRAPNPGTPRRRRVRRSWTPTSRMKRTSCRLMRTFPRPSTLNRMSTWLWMTWCLKRPSSLKRPSCLRRTSQALSCLRTLSSMTWRWWRTSSLAVAKWRRQLCGALCPPVVLGRNWSLLPLENAMAGCSASLVG